jgi:hypothetical protein
MAFPMILAGVGSLALLGYGIGKLIRWKEGVNKTRSHPRSWEVKDKGSGAINSAVQDANCE